MMTTAAIPGAGESVFTRNVNADVERARPFEAPPRTGDITTKFGVRAEDILRLSANESPLGPAEEVRSAIAAASMGDELHRYPNRGYPELRAAIAGLLGVTPAHILPTAGATDIVPLILHSFSNAGDNMVTDSPSVPSSSFVANVNGRECREVPVPFPFEVSADNLLAAVDARTRFVYLCSPNNTTSRFIPLETVRAVARGASNSIVMVDEHYVEAVDGYPSVSAVSLIGELPNLVVIRSFSKLYGLAGMRVGYAVADPQAITILAKLRPRWPISIVSQAAAIAALGAREHLEATRQVVREGRELIANRIAEIPQLRLVPEPQGHFVLFHVGPNSHEVVTRLWQRGVMVRGDMLNEYIRVTVGTVAQCTRFLELLDDALN